MRRLRVVAAACLVLVVSGCVPDAGIPTLPPTPTVTPVFASEEEALAAAEDAYAAYLEMSDLIGSEGGADPERLSEVATGQLLDDAVGSMVEFRESGWVLSGETVIRAASPQFADTVAEPGTVEVVAMYFCVDVSSVDVRDADGSSVVSADRPDLQAVEVMFDLTETGHLLPSASTGWEAERVCG